jgi:hypothetical protein
MFKLIKLAIYGAVGYMLYEMFMGMRQGNLGEGMSGGIDEGRRMGSQSGSSRRGNFTGGGEGFTEQSEEPSGLSAPNAVGRGVISR